MSEHSFVCVSVYVSSTMYSTTESSVYCYSTSTAHTVSTLLAQSAYCCWPSHTQTKRAYTRTDKEERGNRNSRFTHTYASTRNTYGADGNFRMLLLRFFEHQLSERANERVCVLMWMFVYMCVSGVLCCVMSKQPVSAVFVCDWMLFLFFSIVSWLGQYVQYHSVVSVSPIRLHDYCSHSFGLCPNRIFEVFSLTYCHFVIFVAHFVYTQLMMMTMTTVANDIYWKLNEFQNWIPLWMNANKHRKLFYFVLFLW